ncbi:Glutathione S-transferase 8 [Gryganskiella cystojenkinii]|nr:Glutathione S-transferase 8 [Gryganskiella cystojenkinii]
MPALPDSMTLFLMNRNYSGWSLRAWLAMRAFNLKFDIENLIAGTKEIGDLGTPEADAMMRRAGPTAKAPSLHVDNGELIVFETLAIIEFLAEHVKGMWPEDRNQRAYARSLACEMSTSFTAVRNYSMNLRDRRGFQPELFTAQVKKDFNRLSDIWEGLRVKAIKNAKDHNKEDEGFLFGSFTALDAMYAPVMFRLRSYGLMDKIVGEHAIAYTHHMLKYGPMKEWDALAALETEVVPRNELPPATEE